MPVTNASETFPSMLQRLLRDRLDPGAGTFVEMFAPNGVLEYPFAPPGLNTPLEGRDAIVANFERVRKLLRIDGVTDAVLHQTSDQRLAIIEFYGHGEGLLTAEPYRQRYISVIEMEGGYITHYKDYWNPLTVLQAVKGRTIMDAVTMDDTRGTS